MVRWEPGTAERLMVAALDLYAERGFEQTTVTDIAAAVGLTERTFFRHFADKREVLFDGQEQFRARFTDAIAAAPDGTGALGLVTAALDGAAHFFTAELRPTSRRRQAVITANPSLQERELLKLAGLSVALGDALRARGVGEPAATIAADSAVTVFTSAFVRWVAPGESRPFAELAHDGLLTLREFAAPTPRSAGLSELTGPESGLPARRDPGFGGSAATTGAAAGPPAGSR